MRPSTTCHNPLTLGLTKPNVRRRSEKIFIEYFVIMRSCAFIFVGSCFCAKFREKYFAGGVESKTVGKESLKPTYAEKTGGRTNYIESSVKGRAHSLRALYSLQPRVYAACCSINRCSQLTKTLHIS